MKVKKHLTKAYEIRKSRYETGCRIINAYKEAVSYFMRTYNFQSSFIRSMNKASLMHKSQPETQVTQYALRSWGGFWACCCVLEEAAFSHAFEESLLLLSPLALWPSESSLTALCPLRISYPSVSGVRPRPFYVPSRHSYMSALLLNWTLTFTEVSDFIALAQDCTQHACHLIGN